MNASQWILLVIAFLSGIAGVIGAFTIKNGNRSKLTFPLMVGVFLAECSFLYVRGEMRGKCPLGDWGEILLFIAWSLTIFYIVVGSTYRVSLLGFFSAPFVFFLAVVALIPGMLEAEVIACPKGTVDYWGELHAALSVLSYGALSLAMVSALMFVALNHKLKSQQLTGGLFKNLPNIRSLVWLTKRLLWVGVVILTFGILSSLKMESFSSHLGHLLVAFSVWAAYIVFLLIEQFRGMTPNTFSKYTIILFFASLIPFALI